MGAASQQEFLRDLDKKLWTAAAKLRAGLDGNDFSFNFEAQLWAAVDKVHEQSLQ